MNAIAIFIAISIVIIVINFIYDRFCLSNLYVELKFSKTYATEGDELYLTEILTNAKWLPLPWVAVKFQISKYLVFRDTISGMVTDAYYRNDLFSILMQQRITRRLPFVCTKRGVYPIDKLEITSWDIFMNSKHARRFDTDGGRPGRSPLLTVYPAPMDSYFIEHLCTRVYGQMATKDVLFSDPFSFRGIREYVSTDSMKNINHKASAKTGTLMVNLREFSSAKYIVIMLNLQNHNHWHNDDLNEKAIRLIAGIAEAFSNSPISFLTNAKDSKGEELDILEGLAYIYEGLAYIDLDNKDYSPFSEKINNLIDEGDFAKEFWLISTYHGQDLYDAFTNLKNKSRAVWLLPNIHGNIIDPNNMPFEDIVLV